MYRWWKPLLLSCLALGGISVSAEATPRRAEELRRGPSENLENPDDPDEDEVDEEVGAASGRAGLGAQQLRQGHRFRAVMTLEKAHAADPTNRDVQLALARAYLRTTRSPEAVPLLEELIRVEPDNLEVIRLLARTLGRVGRAEEGLLLVQETIAPPLDGNWLLLAGTVAIRAGALDQARVYLTALDDLEPELPRAALRLVQLAIRAGDLDEAEHVLSTLDTTEVNDPKIPLHLGHIARARGDFDGALEEYEMAATTRRRLETVEHIAETWLDKGDNLMARVTLEEGIRMQRSVIRTHAGRRVWASLAIEDGNFRWAEELLNDALRFDPDEGRSWRVMAHLEYARGHRQQAALLLERASLLDTTPGMAILIRRDRQQMGL